MEDGPCIMLMRPGKCNPHEFNLTDLLRVSFLLQDISLISNDNMIIAGFMQIGDFEDFSMAHLLQLSPSLIKRFGFYVEEGMPMRIKNSHFFNTGVIFEKMFATVKLVLPAKMVERVSW